jgi:hypothetical protein
MNTPTPKTIQKISGTKHIRTPSVRQGFHHKKFELDPDYADMTPKEFDDLCNRSLMDRHDNPTWRKIEEMADMPSFRNLLEAWKVLKSKSGIDELSEAIDHILYAYVKGADIKFTISNLESLRKRFMPPAYSSENLIYFECSNLLFMYYVDNEMQGEAKRILEGPGDLFKWDAITSTVFRQVIKGEDMSYLVPTILSMQDENNQLIADAIGSFYEACITSMNTKCLHAIKTYQDNSKED